MSRRVSCPILRPPLLIIDIAGLFETINDSFTTEMTAKQTKLNVTEQSVRTATQALAEKRQALARAQSTAGDVEHVDQRIENLRRMPAASPSQYTGRQPGDPSPAFRPDSTPELSAQNLTPPAPGEADAIKKLRRMVMWEDRMSQVLVSRVAALESQKADRATKYRKVISLCTKVPVGEVDGMLDRLTAAVSRCHEGGTLIVQIESDGGSIDMSRITNVVNRVKEAPAVA